MAIRDICQLGNDVIRATAEAVAFPLSEAHQQLITDLVDTMRSDNVIGLAAPQVGESVRILVTEIRPTEFRQRATEPLKVFINPQITSFSEETEVGYEGCGSVAETRLFGEVERAKTVDVSWFDEHGTPQTGTFSGLMARLVQHEYDHLDGIVFTDKLYTTKTLMSSVEYKKLA
ncbi:MAG: peptide deformylase [Alphaproteobacteria bacterium]|nr:peptide deformylase [Alphaproteobacteria bacterium]MDD9920572.1 peptide deformylase [Alphaproteobacteria bacterium]